MRRLAVIGGLFLGLMMGSQAKVSAGHLVPDDCSSSKCNLVPCVVDSLGLSYFRRGSYDSKNRNCPPYIYPNRAPRDFWMLR